MSVRLVQYACGTDSPCSKNTLYQAHSYENVAEKFGVPVDQVKEVITRAIPRLRSHREKTRPRPHLDDKILTGWNGLMVSTRKARSLKCIIHEISIDFRSCPGFRHPPC